MLILEREEKNIMMDSLERYRVTECNSCAPNFCLNDGVCQVRHYFSNMGKSKVAFFAVMLALSKTAKNRPLTYSINYSIITS